MENINFLVRYSDRGHFPSPLSFPCEMKSFFWLMKPLFRSIWNKVLRSNKCYELDINRVITNDQIDSKQIAI